MYNPAVGFIGHILALGDTALTSSLDAVSLAHGHRASAQTQFLCHHLASSALIERTELLEPGYGSFSMLANSVVNARLRPKLLILSWQIKLIITIIYSGNAYAKVNLISTMRADLDRL